MTRLAAATLALAAWLIPASAAAEEKGASEMTIPDKALIIVFGDSITHMGTVADAEKRWPRVVEKRLRDSGREVTVVASGVPGQTTDGAMKRFEKDVLERKPDLVLIEFGCNDSWRKDGTNPLTPPERFESNIKEMIRLVREKTKAKVVLIKNHARSYILDSRAKGTTKFGDEDYGELLAEIAKDTNTPMLDLFTPFVESFERRAELYKDKDSIHLAEAGSLLYARIVGDYLEKLFVKK
jgi:lysophospholipase L1-like esterase